MKKIEKPYYKVIEIITGSKNFNIQKEKIKNSKIIKIAVSVCFVIVDAVISTILFSIFHVLSRDLMQKVTTTDTNTDTDTNISHDDDIKKLSCVDYMRKKISKSEFIESFITGLVPSLITEETAKAVAARYGFVFTYTTIFNIVEFSIYMKRMFGNVKQYIAEYIDEILSKYTDRETAEYVREFLQKTEAFSYLERLIIKYYKEEHVKFFTFHLRNLPKVDQKTREKISHEISTLIKSINRSYLKLMTITRIIAIVSHYIYAFFHKYGLGKYARIMHFTYNFIVSVLLAKYLECISFKKSNEQAAKFSKQLEKIYEPFIKKGSW